jgi:hypothetical protein
LFKNITNKPLVIYKNKTEFSKLSLLFQAPLK